MTNIPITYKVTTINYLTLVCETKNCKERTEQTWVWWYIPIIPELEKWPLDYKPKVGLGYVISPCLSMSLPLPHLSVCLPVAG